MTPWEVIEEALAQRRPPRGQAWLAEQLGEKIQVVNNWKQRGKVPPARYREVASVLGLTVDQIEGLSALPWEAKESAASLSPEVARAAELIDRLPARQRDWMLQVVRDALDGLELAKAELLARSNVAGKEGQKLEPSTSTKRATR